MKADWEIKKLKDIANYSIGLTYSPKDVSSDGIIVLRSSNIQKGQLDLSDIVRVKSAVKDSLKVRQGDILMCSRNGSKSLVEKTATIPILNEEMTFGTFMTVIRGPYNSFLSWFFISDKFREQIGGGENPMINQVTKYMLDEVEIPLPPLSEQQRIVAILDEVFTAIDRAKANAETNLRNARELFESYSGVSFLNPGTWTDKKLGEVCSLYQGIAINAKTKHCLVDKSDLPLLRIKDLKNNTVEQYIDPYNYPKNALVIESDLIYTRTGQIGLVFTGKRGVLHNNSFKIKPDSSVSKDYLFHWLQNPVFRTMIIKLSSKAAQPDITHAIFKQQIISIPPLEEQQAIVAKLDTLSAETKKLEAIYRQKLADLDELKKAILQKAFRGELSNTP